MTIEPSNCLNPVAIAILDDYQNVALQMADWSRLDGKAKITVFNDHIADLDALVERLKPFDVLCIMRRGSYIENTCSFDRTKAHNTCFCARTALTPCSSLAKTKLGSGCLTFRLPAGVVGPRRKIESVNSVWESQ